MAVRRNFNRQRVMQIYEQIQATPGVKPAAIARCIGLRKDVIYRYLPGLDVVRKLVYEDEKGRLYPCL